MSHALNLSRRQMLQSSACGFGSLALADILHAASKTDARIRGMTPHAKRVIFLFMAGGPSQMDLFDPKDFIRERHGQKIDSPLRKEVIQVGTEKHLALGAMAPVKPRGESGMMISDLMPHLSSVAVDRRPWLGGKGDFGMRLPFLHVPLLEADSQQLIDSHKERI